MRGISDGLVGCLLPLHREREHKASYVLVRNPAGRGNVVLANNSLFLLDDLDSTEFTVHDLVAVHLVGSRGGDGSTVRLGRDWCIDWWCI